ncbi:MAG: hypothetical protein V8T17_06775, partial [Oscillospiraceae bacterium]
LQCENLSLGGFKGGYSLFLKENIPFARSPARRRENPLHFLQEENKRLPFLKNLCYNTGYKY